MNVRDMFYPPSDYFIAGVRANEINKAQRDLENDARRKLLINVETQTEAWVTIANALVDIRNWMQEDRDNRTIDDLPPYVEPKT